jgi:bifunctional UDP-N-acetylglucosamine pyrophosphorylase/glucosamine-1-phosphate N-acetyltransferase
MRSATPKVLHRIAGRSMLAHALAAVSGLSPDIVIVVVRHERERVAAEVAQAAPDALVVDQDDVPGTGRAFSCALEALDAAGGPGGPGRVVVTYGDVPLLRTETMRALIDAGEAGGAAVAILTAVVDDPSGYGRVVRGPSGQVDRVVEHRDADGATRSIREINTGVYALDPTVARQAVASLRPANSAGELYLTDVVGIARSLGHGVAAVVVEDPDEVAGVNDRSQLASARRRFNERVLDRHMTAGVDVLDPETTWVGADVRLAPDVVLLPGTHLEGVTVVGSGAEIGPDTTIADTVVGAGARVLRSHVTGSTIGAGATVGPFSYVRPGTRLGDLAKIGAYVETKSAEIGDGAKVPHLSYVGDAVIGRGSNIGAATIVANYDGVAKHRTVVGEHVRIGSDTVLVAPVTVGDGAYTAAGSVVDDDVPPGALAVARGRLHISEGWVTRRRSGTSSAKAAERALSGHNGAVRASAADTHGEQATSATSEGEGE